MMTKRPPMMTMLLLLAAVFAPATAIAAPGRSAQAGAAAAQGDIKKTLGFVPQFFLKFPQLALPGFWDEMKGLQLNPSTALPGKVKELIGLAVAAQIPCRYCVYAHTEFAKLNGATAPELGEAVAMAGLTRHWSAFLNGLQTDPIKWRGEVARIVENARAAAKTPPGASAPAPAAVVDGQTALADIAYSLGFAPEFLKRFPEPARAGAWRELKEVQLNSQSVLTGKVKELIGLAVAAQMPCTFCIVAHTEFAKLNGASDAEITEAIAMGAYTRNVSTLLNGLEIDEPQFRRDIDRLVKGARAAADKARVHTAAR
jgi:AhpD family alkylhydroperoxidase